MKKTFFLTGGLLLMLLISNRLFSQVEIKGTGSTGSTFTLITKNSSSDTSLVVKDDGNVGIGTKVPGYDLEVSGTLKADTLLFSDGTIQTTSASLARVVTVATIGGDFNNVQAALGYCASLLPGPNNQFHIRVLPGNYPTQLFPVICLKFVHLKGAGKYSCTINDPVVGADSCVIEDFFLTQGVVCNATSPTIIHNIITNTSTDNAVGIYISNGGRPWIKENEILDCNGFGIADNDFGSDAWIIANKILRNEGGGIMCQNSSPLISNNLIDNNNIYGIYLIGAIGTPAEPTIDDNVIGHTDYQSGGVGIYITDYAEPRVIANDIYLNEVGIEIHPNTQPSILSNNINYNWDAGIRTMSNGAGKPVVIQGNHIHSSARGQNPAGIWITGGTIPIIAQNVVIDNDPSGVNPDIDYSSNLGIQPVLNLNMFDLINRGFPGPGTGQYNVDSQGNIIFP